MTTSTGLRLEPITPANIEAALAIRVRPEQEFAVSPVVKSLAEAYVHGEKAWPRLIVDGDRPVGFLMGFFGIDWYDDGSALRSGLWRLNIDAGEQGRGTAASRWSRWPPRSGAAAARSASSPGTPASTAPRTST